MLPTMRPASRFSSDTTVNCSYCAIAFPCCPRPSVPFDSLGKNPFGTNSLDPTRCIVFREDGFQKEDNTFNDVRFEEAAILYNIGALYSRLGANEARRTHEVPTMATRAPLASHPLVRRASKMRAPTSDVPLPASRRCAIRTRPTRPISHRIS